MSNPRKVHRAGDTPSLAAEVAAETDLPLVLLDKVIHLMGWLRQATMALCRYVEHM
jgi:hypothetical protein